MYAVPNSAANDVVINNWGSLFNKISDKITHFVYNEYSCSKDIDI